jgi:hypothetical protein
VWLLDQTINQHEKARDTKHVQAISGSWFRASAMTTMNKNQPDAH